MKQIYGCDLVDGLGSVFSKAVGSAWDYASGNSLLKKYGLSKMRYSDSGDIQMLGAGAGLLIGLVAAFSIADLKPDNIGFFAALLTAVATPLAGAAISTLPRNAYVACKARKEEDMKREAVGAGPQPPQV